MTPRISLLVPFRPTTPQRERVWLWLERYWRHELPGVEIIVGSSTRTPFSKTEAVNDAARRARGQIFVILDSDAYLRGRIIRHCATRIEQALQRGERLWYMPYRHLYRLTETATETILCCDPRSPPRFERGLPRSILETPRSAAYGHRYGAMIQIMPREAFNLVGGMDPRFAGWGGEDVAFLRALDTLYCPHRTLTASIFHLWHPAIGSSPLSKRWKDQPRAGSNSKLTYRYFLAQARPEDMRALVDEPRPTLAKRIAHLWQTVIGFFRRR